MNNSVREIVNGTIKSMPVETTIGESKLLNSFSAKDVFNALQEIFDTETDSAIKSRAFDAILKLEELDKVHFLISLYEQSSIDWQIACCRNLTNFRDNRAIKKLCDIALTNDDPDVRLTAVESLAQIGDISAVDSLQTVSENDTGYDYEGFKVADIAEKAIASILDRANNH